jgi:hypothetical protein
MDLFDGCVVECFGEHMCLHGHNVVRMHNIGGEVGLGGVA